MTSVMMMTIALYLFILIRLTYFCDRKRKAAIMGGHNGGVYIGCAKNSSTVTLVYSGMTTSTLVE
jgi:hypothetical protein